METPALTPAPGGIPTPKATALPPVAMQPTRTDFDVDLHKFRPGDSYQTVSQRYYDTPQFAEALRAFNQGRPVDATGQIEVPPLAIIRKLSGRGKAVEPREALQPVGRVQTAGDNLDWGPAGSRNRNEVRIQKYIVPREGMTFRDVAFELYGTERDWGKIDNRQNYKYRPDEKLPKGAELFVPVEDINWR
jgi:hypothetical protein